MTTIVPLDLSLLRSAIQHEYDEVASCPAKGFHFHVGRPLAAKLGYPGDWVGSLPDPVVESFAGVGNPDSWGELATGENALLVARFIEAHMNVLLGPPDGGGRRVKRVA